MFNCLHLSIRMYIYTYVYVRVYVHARLPLSIFVCVHRMDFAPNHLLSDEMRRSLSSSPLTSPQGKYYEENSQSERLEVDIKVSSSSNTHTYTHTQTSRIYILRIF